MTWRFVAPVSGVTANKTADVGSKRGGVRAGHLAHLRENIRNQLVCDGSMHHRHGDLAAVLVASTGSRRPSSAIGRAMGNAFPKSASSTASSCVIDYDSDQREGTNLTVTIDGRGHSGLVCGGQAPTRTLTRSQVHKTRPATSSTAAQAVGQQGCSTAGTLRPCGRHGRCSR